MPERGNGRLPVRLSVVRLSVFVFCCCFFVCLFFLLFFCFVLFCFVFVFVFVFCCCCFYLFIFFCLFVCLFCFLLLFFRLSKYRWIFTKLDMCIDIVKIWFRMANGQISSFFDRAICPLHDNGRYYRFTFSLQRKFLIQLYHKLFFLLNEWIYIISYRLLIAFTYLTLKRLYFITSLSKNNVLSDRILNAP